MSSSSENDDFLKQHRIEVPDLSALAVPTQPNARFWVYHRSPRPARRTRLEDP